MRYRSWTTCLYIVVMTYVRIEAAAFAESALAPTVADFAYGTESEQQKLDFFKANASKPTPLVFMIHGGGWMQGDKRDYEPKVIVPYLNAGVSVARINYRLIDTAMQEKVDPPVKAPLLDAARALQICRHKCKDWNIDPARIGATGISAGGCTSLWLALRDDLADSHSADPVARESTRLRCAAVEIAQTSLDPQQLRTWMPNADYSGHAFGFKQKGRPPSEEFDLLLANRERLLPLIKEYSPIEWASRDDPPLYLDYVLARPPAKIGTPESDPAHSPINGMMLAQKMQEQGVEAVLSYKGNEDKRYGSVRAFLMEKLTKP